MIGALSRSIVNFSSWVLRDRLRNQFKGWNRPLPPSQPLTLLPSVSDRRSYRKIRWSLPRLWFAFDQYSLCPLDHLDWVLSIMVVYYPHTPLTTSVRIDIFLTSIKILLSRVRVYVLFFIFMKLSQGQLRVKIFIISTYKMAVTKIEWNISPISLRNSFTLFMVVTSKQ